MFIIYEHNGEHCIGEVLNKKGEVMKFESEQRAKVFAKKNCAFNYKIIKI